MSAGALPLAPTPGATNQSSQNSWEGDKMFNIYIYDYCNKRGFRETAQKLMQEAEIAPDSAPPINAKQGLLFEWWSVFWVLFTAKSNGTGSEDAMLYVQQQARQSAERQAQARMQPTNPAPMNRYVNGMTRPPGGLPPNGPVNGASPASLHGAQGPMPNGAPGMSFPMGSNSQINGIQGNPAGSQPSSSSFQPMLANQRPGGPPQRGPGSGPPFQSPTMAHSPQNPGNLQQPPPMSQLGPSTHMGNMQPRGMMPPNGAQLPQQASNPAFQQIQRPPSRTASPSNMIHPSPSMQPRPSPMGTLPNPSIEHSINMELQKMPPLYINQLKNEAGLGDKEVAALNLEERQRLVLMARKRQQGPQANNNAAAGPSMQRQQQQMPPQQRPPPPNQQQPQQQRSNKRNSSSPGEENETLPKNDSSPPDRKRLRRSPDQGPPMHPMGYLQQPQQGGPGGPQHMQNGMMGRPVGAPNMNGYPQGAMQGMSGNPAMMMQQMGGQPMGGPQMNSPMGTPQQQQQQQQQQQRQMFQEQQYYRQTMQNVHQSKIPPGAMPHGMPGSAGSPAADGGPGPQFGGGPQNPRLNQNKGPGGMMPPPSPAANGPPKDQGGPPKDNKGGPGHPNNRPDGSPRNAPPNTAQGPSNSGGSGQGGTAPPTPNMTAPSPSAILNPSMAMNQPNHPMSSSVDPMSGLFGGNDFIGSMPLDSTFEDSFKGTIDVDFERDFGQWFNPENDLNDITGLGEK